MAPGDWTAEQASRSAVDAVCTRDALGACASAAMVAAMIRALNGSS